MEFMNDFLEREAAAMKNFLHNISVSTTTGFLKCLITKKNLKTKFYPFCFFNIFMFVYSSC